MSLQDPFAAEVTRDPYQVDRMGKQLPAKKSGRKNLSSLMKRDTKKESLTIRFKKYFGSREYEGKDTWFAKNWWLLLALAGIFLLALFMRSYFYYPLASEMGFSGNDPYYHKNVVDHIQSDYTHLIEDDMLNYPVHGVNPRPPLYNWFIAIFGIVLSPLFGFNVELCTNTIMYFAPSFFGALTIFPVYFLTKEMFGKKSGVISAFLMATMPSHIERSPAGFSDHDSIVVFFVVLSVFLLFRAFSALKHEDWVKNWRSTDSIYRGFSNFFSKNQVAVYYSLLAGVSLASIALTWKGFPYALVIIIIYYLLQLLFDRFRHVDSTGIFVCTFLALFTSLAVSFPYYATLSFGTWSTPVYFLAAVVVIGVLLIPTRDYPWIIVLPLGIIASIVGYLFLNIIAPAAAEALITGQGYFVKSKLYSTIAEAQPPEFSRLIVSYAMIVFFLAVIGIVKAGFQIPRHWKKEYIFIVVWAIVAVYMAMMAVRFMFNATPVIVIVAGWTLYNLVNRLNLKSKILIFYTLGLGFTSLLLAWWGVDHGFGAKYTWILFMGATSMIVIPIIVAVYDNYDKRSTTMFVGGMLAIWTLAVIVLLIMDKNLKWGSIGTALEGNADIWYFGLAALGITLIPIIIFLSRKSFAVIHLVIFPAIPLLLFALRDVGSFDAMFTSKYMQVVFGYSIIPLVIFAFNIYFLFMDKKYKKETSRKVLFVGIELWVISFFFDPNTYVGLVTFALFLVNIYLLTPYRKSFRNKTEPMHVTITLFVVLFVLLPHLWFAIDASLPYENKYEMNDKVYRSIPDFLHDDDVSPNKYFGAFGHGFTSEYWRAAFEWLSQQDTDLPPEERPGFVSWWDYGFWCVYLGQHPTAADNFQYGYQFAGSFLAAQNESEAISLMIARTIEGGVREKDLKEEIAGILEDEKYFGNEMYESNAGAGKLTASEKLFEMIQKPEKYVDEVKNNPEKYGRFLQLLPGNARYAAVRGMLIPLGEEKIVDLMVDLEDITDNCIRYFAVDYRLFPFTAQNTGIFYAPIKLADKDVGDFLDYVVVLDDGREIPIDEFEEMVDTDPTIQEQVIDYKLQYTDQFYNSMFYRCYIGYSGKDLGEGDLGVPIVSPQGEFQSNQRYFQPMQGWNMSHFKLVYRTAYYTPKDPDNASFPEDFDAMNSDEAIELYNKQGGYQVSGLKQGAFFLKYYHGAYIRGTVRTEGENGGVPMPGVRVTVADEYGIPHDMCFTDENGNYNLTAPFGENNIVVSKDGYDTGESELFSHLVLTEKTIINRTTITVSDEQAMRLGDWIIDKDLIIERSSINGKVYLDVNNNDVYDESMDSLIDNADILITSKDERNITFSTYTENGGEFNFSEVLPVEYGFSVKTSGHTINLTDTAEVDPQQEGDWNIITQDLGIAPGNISGNITYANETGAPYVRVHLDDDNGTRFSTLTNETGYYEFDGLLAGDFSMVINETLYEEIEERLEVTEGTRTIQNFTLREVVPVSGKVFFDRFSDGMDDNDLLNNVKIKFIDTMDPTNTIVVKSDENGNYITTLSVGNYSLYVHHIDGEDHYTAMKDMEFRAGSVYVHDIRVYESIKIEGAISVDSSISGENDENSTKGIPIRIRGGEGTYIVPTNMTSYYVTYLPEGEYFISTEIFLMNGISVGATHVEGKSGETVSGDMTTKKSFVVSGFVFWDRNGDMNVTMGNDTIDVINISEMIKTEEEAMSGATAEGTVSGVADTLTRSDETDDTADTSENGEEYTSDNGSLDIGNITNDTNVIVPAIYENLTPLSVDFQKGESVLRATTNESGFFMIALPEGAYTMRIESDEIAKYESVVSVGEEDERFFIPPVKPRNVTFDISLGVDRNYDMALTDEEILRSFEIEFKGASDGAVNASFSFRKGVSKRGSLVPGDYEVTYFDEYILSGTSVRQSMKANITLGLGESDVPLKFFADEMIRFHGRAETISNEPASNITIRLNSTVEERELEITCDIDGNFDEYIPFGNYFARAEYTMNDTNYLYRSMMDITPGKSPFSIMLGRAYAYELQVYFDKDQNQAYMSTEKLANVPVIISGDITSSHTTDYNGKITTYLLPDKTYSISIDHLTSDSTYRYIASKTVTMPENDIDEYLPVTKYLKLKGNVFRDKNGDGNFQTEEKITNASLDFTFDGAWEEYSVGSDADGKWNAYLPVFYNNYQVYDLRVAADGYFTRDLTKNISAGTKGFDISLDPEPLRYSGYFFKDTNDNDTMDPGETALPFHEVTLIPESEEDERIIVASDSKGYYEVDLYPGNYEVETLIKGENVFIFEGEEKVEVGNDKRFDIPLKRGKYVFGSISYVDTDGIEHKNINVQDNKIIIEGMDNDIVRELDFYNGYYETYLPNGQYSYEMEGYSTDEYGMEMEYRFSKDTITIDDSTDFVDLPLGKVEDTTLDVSILNVMEGEDFERTVNQGESVELELRVENQGNIPQTLAISGKDLPEGWSLTITPRDAVLDIKESIRAEIVVETSFDSLRSNELAIEINSDEGSSEQVELTIQTYPKYRVEVDSPDDLNRGFLQNETKSFDISVENQGNAGDEIRFFLRNVPSEDWNITIQGVALNSSGYLHEYNQDDIFKNLSFEIVSPNLTKSSAVFEIGVESNWITDKTIVVNAVISKPDISITDVTFRNLDLSDEDANVTMLVTLHNAFCDVKKFNLSVYLDDEKINELSESIESIPQGKDYELVFDWNLSAMKGKHKVDVYIDEDDKIQEKDDITNNHETVSIRVGPGGSDAFNWRIVVAIFVVVVIVVVSYVIWKKKQIV